MAANDSIFLGAHEAPGQHSVQRCDACGADWHELDASPACPHCGGLLAIIHRAPLDSMGAPAAPAALQHAFAQHCCARPSGHPSGVWRFEQVVMPAAGAAITSHPEGNTPLLSRARVSAWAGCDGLLLKHEGYNPTGSFKDRGMTVGTTQAVRTGATAVACASTGNTSASLASYAAQAGIPGLVFVPAGKVALGKMAQTLAYGATTLLVRGDFDDCLRLVQDASRELGIYLLNSINPWRVEGQKTIVLELLQQMDWHVPDFLVLPAGNLGNTAAFGKALREAHALGLIHRMPRLVSVQAAGAAPFATAFRDSFRERLRVQAETIATAIRIGDPASWDRAVRAIRDTDGLVLSVTDEEIIDAKVQVDAAGVGCEPASAASVAGVRQLVRSGVIRSGDRVVAVLTGHVLKDPGMLVELHQQRDDFAHANRPVEIEASVRAVADVLARRTREGA
ncbi:threonine synthase [Gemmatimonas sp.]|jgi:threonine synthase|uniref:threonine synthase n=1 Tax=Gemmatimonas sp. TaxID=1962908 RepID=UPI0025BF7DC4|nr:threonine synthase [Gemmatimonas sp.]MCA2986291.1 threonine synthase [Gemmatimonas sp.]MCA2993245.1 threonine synthase [Gemmatimonas sp.]MCA2995974.1 threonine synthase [Gemmatimonas sp.]